MSSLFKSNLLPGANGILLDGHPLPTWIVGVEDLVIAFANKAAIGLYEYTDAEFNEKSFLGLFSSESRAIFFQKYTQGPQPSGLNGCYRHRKKNGQPLAIELFASAIFLNNTDYYQLTAIDISEKTSAQQRLQQESTRYKAYIENSAAGIFCHEFKLPVPVTIPPEEFVAHLQKDGAVSECNPAFAKMYGYEDPSAMIGLLPTQMLNFEDRANIDLIISFVKNGFRLLNQESHEKDKDGNSLFFLNSSVGIIEDGYLKRIWGTQIDITEKKKAERSLLESEKRFKEVADLAPVMIWMGDENDKITYLNKKWQEFTGEDQVGTEQAGWFSFVHTEDYLKAKEQYETAFRQREQTILIYRLRRKDGTYRWVHDISVPRFLDDKTFVGYIGSVVDIEEQKRKEEQLRYQATVMDNVSDIIITSSMDCGIIFWNKTAEEFYGIPAEEAIGKQVTEVVALDYLGTTREKAVEQLFETGIWKGEVAHTDKCGVIKYLLNTVSVVVNEKGEQIGILSVGRDISDRKIAEQKLQQSESFYRTLIANSLDGIILVNGEGTIGFCSPSIKHVLGFDCDEVIGRNGFQFVHPEDLQLAAESFEKEIDENPEVKFITIRLLHKNGQWVWCMVRGHNLFGNSEVGSIVIYFHNDTMRKQALEALKESEKRFRDLVKDLQIGVLLQDADGRIETFNNTVLKIFNLNEEELPGMLLWKNFSDAINEKGQILANSEKPFYKALQTRQPVKDVVMGIWHPRKKERIWLLINIDPILDADGNVQHVISSFTDITERKKLEQKLLSESINHQKQLTQATIDGQEAERREIGKELHDNIGQQLTTIKLFLDMVKSTATEANEEMLSMALKGVADVINEIRSISRALLPHTLQDLGLIDSITELIDSLRRTQLLKIHFACEDFTEEILPDNQKLTLFRIIQEQFNNIAKHAEAKNVFVILKNTTQNVILEIRDDGKGFDVKTVRKGLGFTNIRNRIELFGGHVEIAADPGQGCYIKISMPVVLVQFSSVTDSYN